MSATNEFQREAEVLARMLGHVGSLEAIHPRYAAFAAREADHPRGDRALELRFLRRGGVLARAASAWAARFDRCGPLRRRETLMLALLECRPESMAAVDRSSDGGPVSAWPRLVYWGFCEVLLLLLALPFFVPARLLGGRS